MDSEESKTILKLINEFSCIFHIDGNQLTFATKIKQHIRTTDEMPVYTRSYRHAEI